MPGQHVALFTDDMPRIYTALGFRHQAGGMSQAVGAWLDSG